VYGLCDGIDSNVLGMLLVHYSRGQRDLGNKGEAWNVRTDQIMSLVLPS